ncbi:MAG TPA: ATP-binding protein [Solirubrobacterales bacterium]|nr:ATP-binding protein [Solirubrobacterales bacterium]
MTRQPEDNPYTPNAGARPPLLAGRSDELEAFELLLGRLRRGYTAQSMIIIGLRGVGKTVLLGEFLNKARARGWTTVDAEITKHEDFGQRMAMLARRALLQVAPRARWKERGRRAAQILRSFQVTVNPEGEIAATLGDVDPLEGMADSGGLAEDLTDVLVAIGEAAQEQSSGVVFLFDEVHFLRLPELEALIAALHKTVQRSLPVTFVGAGLPQLPELAGEAKSYAERLFKFPLVGSLPRDEATKAIVDPARESGVDFEPGAVEEIVAYSEGYPYFLQEYGSIVWDMGKETTITHRDVEEARDLVEAKLDGSFFRVRAERTTDLELQYLRAMAELGSKPQQARDVAKLLNRTSEQLGPTRARLIDKGLLYTPGFGLAAFTVPQFDRYMRRAHKLVVPPVQRRRKQ